MSLIMIESVMVKKLVTQVKVGNHVMKSMIHRLIVKHMVEINNLSLFYSIKTAAYMLPKNQSQRNSFI